VPTRSAPEAAWEAALQRFREAARARDIWNEQNPFPQPGAWPDDPAAERTAAQRWEQDVEIVNGPYSDAADALRAMPAPSLEAVIVKLALVRSALDGYEVERDLDPFIRSIERDIERLARQSL
jgi:hypothetical protein